MEAGSRSLEEQARREESDIEMGIYGTAVRLHAHAQQQST